MEKCVGVAEMRGERMEEEGAFGVAASDAAFPTIGIVATNLPKKTGERFGRMGRKWGDD